MKTNCLLLLLLLVPLSVFSQTRQLTLTPSIGLKLQNLDITDSYNYFSNSAPLRPEMGLDLGYRLSKRFWLHARSSLVPLSFRLRSKEFQASDVYPEFNTNYWAPGWGLGVDWEVFRENRQSVQIGYQLNVNHLRPRENATYFATIQVDGLPTEVTTLVNRTYNAFFSMNLTLTYEMELSYNQSIVIYGGRTFGSSGPEEHRFSFQDPSGTRTFSSPSTITNNGGGFFLRVGYRFYLIKQVKGLEF